MKNGMTPTNHALWFPLRDSQSVHSISHSLPRAPARQPPKLHRSGAGAERLGVLAGNWWKPDPGLIKIGVWVPQRGTWVG